ncbi:MAG: hypothetical protein KC445_05560 [Anaerolineales bacterium]|nr:hypothetical protein [Anaerolineales bacterium]
MTVQIRPAAASDLPHITDLLIQDAAQRHQTSPALWPLADNGRERVANTVHQTLESSKPPFAEQWLVAEDAGHIVGVSHALKVPVPPIYAGAFGPPGLLLDDCFTAENAPPETAEALLLAAEAALRRAGSELLLASCLAEGPRRSLLEQHGYRAITLYLGKAGFAAESASNQVRPAKPEDVPGIVAASAEHRATLAQISERFWQRHPEADTRFSAWMQRSLTLTDRDMFVAEAQGQVAGYIIAQPISPLLVPVAHDISGIGVIDDFYHANFADITEVTNEGSGAANLLQAAENAFTARQVDAAFVVCPAGWASKISILAQHGYQPAKVWLLKG